MLEIGVTHILQEKQMRLKQLDHILKKLQCKNQNYKFSEAHVRS